MILDDAFSKDQRRVAMETIPQPPGKIHAAMIEVMRAVKHIGKDKRNQQQGFAYRGIDDVYLALHGCFADAGIYCRTEVLKRECTERATKSGGVMYSVVCDILFHLCAEDGSEITMKIIGEAMDTADKATNKSLAISHKYALLQAFLIPTEDMEDPDASSPEPAPSSSPEPLAPRQAQAPTQRAQAPAKKPTTGKEPAVLDRQKLIAGAHILSSHELTGTNSRGPWTAWKFVVKSGEDMYNAGTFNEDIARVALNNVSETEEFAVDIELKPLANGKIEIVSVTNADDVNP